MGFLDKIFKKKEKQPIANDLNELKKVIEATTPKTPGSTKEPLPSKPPLEQKSVELPKEQAKPPEHVNAKMDLIDSKIENIRVKIDTILAKVDEIEKLIKKAMEES